MWSSSQNVQRVALAHSTTTIRFPPRLLVRCAAHSYNLQPWQQARLEEAYVQGKRKVKVSFFVGGVMAATCINNNTPCLQVNELSKEVGLDRQVVLQWFKDQDALPPRCVVMLMTRNAAFPHVHLHLPPHHQQCTWQPS